MSDYLKPNGKRNKISKEMAVAIMSQAEYFPATYEMSNLSEGVVFKIRFEEDLAEALGLVKTGDDGSGYNYTSPENTDVSISDNGDVNKSGIKFLLEAGVKNPVLEVAAKELGIKVDRSKGGWSER